MFALNHKGHTAIGRPSRSALRDKRAVAGSMFLIRMTFNSSESSTVISAAISRLDFALDPQYDAMPPHLVALWNTKRNAVGLVKRDRIELLRDLKARKRNRELGELEDVLEAWGFKRRDASKENGIWSRGRQTITLPNPHGRPLLPCYVNHVIRAIEAARLEDQEGEDDPNEEA